MFTLSLLIWFHSSFFTAFKNYGVFFFSCLCKTLAFSWDAGDAFLGFFEKAVRKLIEVKEALRGVGEVLKRAEE